MKVQQILGKNGLLAAASSYKGPTMTTKMAAEHAIRNQRLSGQRWLAQLSKLKCDASYEPASSCQQGGVNPFLGQHRVRQALEEALGTCIRMHPDWQVLFRRVQRIYFLDEGQDISR